MTRAVASFVTWLSLLAVTVVAGGYTVTYLFQWQWVRAQIAGIAFVAALVVASTLVVLGRLRRLERRLDILTAQTAERPRPEAAPGAEPRPDFRWLSGSTSSRALLALPLLALLSLGAPDRTVFIPVFLATGLVVASVASAVERLSALRHGDPVLVAARPTAAPAGRRPEAPRAFMLVSLIGAVVIAAVVGGLWRTTHYRSEPLGPGTTTMTVRAQRSGEVIPGREVVEAAGRYCTITSGIDVRFEGVDPGPDGTTLLRLSPLLDEEAQGRYAGCLEDAILDRHSLRVTGTELAPSG